MKYVDEFRDPRLAKKLVTKISNSPLNNVKLMMGGGMIAHVAAQIGLEQMLPSNVTLVPGPGCPRCVTPASSIDRAIAISEFPDTIVTIFGGMMMVPGSSQSLEMKKGEGADVRPVYSCPEALNLATKNPKKNVVFVALGYETTSPTVASTILEAQRKKVENFYITQAHLTFPSVFRAMLEGGEATLDGLLLPGPVCTIIGSKPFDFIPRDYKLPSAITGLETCDILQSILMLFDQIASRKPTIEIQYSRCVNENGNLAAKRVLDEVFEACDASMRGFGVYPKSGLKLRQKYEQYRAEKIFEVAVEESEESKACICGAVLRGGTSPSDCPLFNKVCNQTHPVGPCMVSPQGSCSLHLRSLALKGNV